MNYWETNSQNSDCILMYKIMKKNKNMKLEITKEKVLEAASKCSQAKETLKTLFPECFSRKGNYVDDIDEFKVSSHNFMNGYLFIGKGMAPEGLECKCLVLNNELNWEMKEYDGRTILIPTYK